MNATSPNGCLRQDGSENSATPALRAVNKKSLAFPKMNFAYMGLLTFTLVLLLASLSYSTWANTTFNSCMDVTIVNATTSTLSNFTVYVNITKQPNMQANYSDLRFYNGSCNNDGTLLNF